MGRSREKKRDINGEVAEMDIDRYEAYRSLYGVDGFEKLRNSKLLIVGAGGIGCEILKNMALMGFRTLEIIDLDTIDVSNLNRQFLFRPEHVGQSKALVASKAALRFNPDCQVIPHHANIKDDAFNLQYFKDFDCVLNALDNVDARRHVNRLCLSAGVPLIDSGSTGYRGQVRPIMKGITECYECRAKTTQKVYPICTIRSTPDKPVHCIVWAKEAFKLIFGVTKESMLYEDPSVEQSTFMQFVNIPEIVSTDTDTDTYTHIETIVQTGTRLIHALFCSEIDKRVSMDIYKNAKITPRPTDAGAIQRASLRAISLLKNKNNKANNNSSSSSSSSSSSTSSDVRPSRQPNWDRNIWSDEECAVEILLCHAEACLEHHKHTHTHPDTISGAHIGDNMLVFDKDDRMAMIFVTAMSNMRSRVFYIPTQCLYDAKGMAGNIIPAIATTNAIVAASQVDQACRVVIEGSQVVAKLRNTSVWRVPTSRKREVLSCLRYMEEPIITCFVCQKSPLMVTIDTNVATLFDFVTLVLKGRLGFNAPSVSVGADPIYEEGEDCDEELAENLHLILTQCPAGGIHHNSELTIEDFSQDMNVIIMIQHRVYSDIQKELLNRQEEAAKMGSGESGAPPPDDIFYIDGGSMGKAKDKTGSSETSTSAEKSSSDSSNSSSNSSGAKAKRNQEEISIKNINETALVSNEYIVTDEEEKCKSVGAAAISPTPPAKRARVHI